MKTSIFSIAVFLLLANSYLCVFAQEGLLPFTEVSEEAGIQHAFQVGQATFGGGVAVLDFDRDGWEDLYVTGGDEEDVLYRNNGDGTFTDVRATAGFEATLDVHTQGVASADINRDGYRDLIITTLHRLSDDVATHNLLYLNNGDGTFSDITTSWGLSTYKTNSQGASFADVNADGWPDLYIANYWSSAPEEINIYNEATIVSSFVSAPDFLFINNAGKGFVLANELYGVTHHGFGFVGHFSDFDNDNDVDLMVANDFGFKNTPNLMLRNDFPERKFKDRSVNLALNFGMNAMGIAGCDVNKDGWMDYFVTNISASLFVVNQGNGDPFVNEAPARGLAIPNIVRPGFAGPPISWGANFFDFDHDTDEDLFVANGALNPTIRHNYNFFFVQENGQFNEMSESMQMDDPRIARGSAVFDYDNDGDLDLFVVNQKPRDPTDILPRARCLLYRNERVTGNWLQVALDGVVAEKQGIGSRIEVYAGNQLLVREIDGGSSHLSQNTTIAHFGLGTIDMVDSVVVKWLGGNKQVLTQITANQRLVITETLHEAQEGDDLELLVFPNAFRDHFYVSYELPKVMDVELVLVDMMGRVISTIFSSNQASTRGFLLWEDTDQLLSGSYQLVLKAGNDVTTYGLIKH